MLGDGSHTAQKCGGYHQRSREFVAHQRQHRQGRRRDLSGPRPLQRARRSHHGNLRKTATGILGSHRKSVWFSPATGPRLRCGGLYPGDAQRRCKSVLRDGWQFPIRQPRYRFHGPSIAKLRPYRAGVYQVESQSFGNGQRSDYPALFR